MCRLNWVSDLDREYLNDYHQREVAEYERFLEDLQKGRFDFEKDRFPQSKRFANLQKPVAVASQLASQEKKIWAQVPFCGSLLLSLPPLKQSLFEEFWFKVSEIPKIVDFIKIWLHCRHSCFCIFFLFTTHSRFRAKLDGTILSKPVYSCFFRRHFYRLSFLQNQGEHMECLCIPCCGEHSQRFGSYRGDHGFTVCQPACRNSEFHGNDFASTASKL